MSRADRFLNACRNEPVDCTPVWLMRQAGRYMANYRKLREQYALLDLVKTPELAVEVTLQPVDAFEVDAAIVFADILPLLSAMGLDIEFVKGDGPVVHNPVRAPADIDALIVPAAEESLGFTIEAVRLARQALDGRVPLIGFSGAPFTLASYAIEGGGSKQFQQVKTFMYSEPVAWHAFMDKITLLIIDYLKAQAAAGAQTLQLFDSWAGALSPVDYQENVLPYLKRIADEVQGAYPDVPFVYFSTGTGGYLELVKEVGAGVNGVDWRVDLMSAWETLGTDHGIQGNLEPMLLLGSEETAIHRSKAILDSVAGRSGHIFNLGHGVLKETSVDMVENLINAVHEHTAGQG